MLEMNNIQNYYTQEEAQAVQSTFISKVYTWMTGALLLTAIIAQYVASTPELLNQILGNRMMFFGLIIAQLGMVWYLSARINRIDASTATALFIGYAALNGLTLSVVFIAYTMQSIATTFYVTAGTFAVMSAYGYFTKSDLTRVGNLAFMALIGIIIASVVNMFLRSETLYWIITYAGVLIFVGLVAYDTQKIKQMSLQLEGNVEGEKKGAVMGALMLYLDFINLFLYLLRLLGDRR